jgi:hypothetical protein
MKNFEVPIKFQLFEGKNPEKQAYLYIKVKESNCKNPRSPKKKRKKDNLKDENQPEGKSPMKDISHFLVYKPEMTFFSSPFHRLDTEANQILDSLMNNLTHVPNLLIEKVPFCNLNLNREEFPNLSNEQLQSMDQYQISILSPISILQIPHLDLETISLIISRSSNTNPSNQIRINLETEAAELADGFIKTAVSRFWCTR